MLQKVGLTAVLLVSIQASDDAAQPATASAKLAPKVEAAWAKIGATTTWFGQGSDHWYTMRSSPDGLTDAMVYFWFPSPAKLENLTSLDMGYSLPPVKDEGLERIKQLKHLTNLTLGGSFITDAGLENIKEMKNLKQLWLGGKFTDVGIKKLRETLPGCEIKH